MKRIFMLTILEHLITIWRPVLFLSVDCVDCVDCVGKRNSLLFQNSNNVEEKRLIYAMAYKYSWLLNIVWVNQDQNLF